MARNIMKPADGVVWITGASSGIGYETSMLMAKQGWTVAATARRESALQELADASAAAGHKGRIVAFAGDTTDRARMADIVEEIETRLGPIALVLLNAGIYLPLEVPELDADTFRKSWEVNIMGTVHGLEPVIPRMITRAKGHIAIVSSVTGYGGLPTSAAYGGTKAALNNIAECMKIELDRHKVRVSVICPGFVETPAQDDNEFPKPDMVTADEAARQIVRGLKSNNFEITFPWRFTFTLKLLKWLPRGFYTNLIKRQTGWNKPVS